LARTLVEGGHAVRGTTRDEAHTEGIEAVGAEPVIADPNRIATLMPAIDRVAIVCILLGSARGGRESLEVLHGSRLEMLLTRLIDTTVRGVVYEARGSLPPELLAQGAQRVRRACKRSRFPFALLDVPPEDHRLWLESAMHAVGGLLDPQRG
jgi:hypothetical protein